MCEECLQIVNSFKKSEISYFIIFQAAPFWESAMRNKSIYAELSEQSAINREVIHFN